MYSGACCLRCYRRAAYGADSIRAKLALDNPSDRARPDRPASASPPASCVPRAPVTGRHLRHGACGHGRGRAGGPRGPGKGPGAPRAGGGAGGLSGRRGSDKQAERAPGSESEGSQPAFGVHLESDTLGRVARPAKRWHRKGQRGRKRRRGQGTGSDRCVCECRVLALNATRLGTTPPPGGR